MPSKGEQRVRKAIESLGKYRIVEQYPLPDRLRLDFYIPELSLGIEVDGIQHDEFNAHFYDGKDAFKSAQVRDRKKEQYCSDLAITLIRLPYNTVMRATSAEDLSKEILRKYIETNTETQADKDDW